MFKWSTNGLLLKRVDLIEGLRLQTTMGISEILKLDGRLSRTSFYLKIWARLIKSKALLLKVKLHL